MIEQHNSLAEKFLKKGFWLYLFSFIIAPIWYIIKIIISWELSVEEVWIIYWIISLITLLAAYNDLWVTESLKYFLPQYITEKRYDKVKTILSLAFIVQLSTSIIIAWFLFYWADFLGEHYFKNELAVSTLKIFSVFLLWYNIFQLVNTFFLAIQNTFYNKLTEFFRMLFILISVLIIFFFDLSSIKNYSYTWVIWLYVWIITALIIFIKKYYSKYLAKEKIIWDKKLIKTILKYSLISFLWIQTTTILSQIDMQMIIYLLWVKEAWYYTNYLSIIIIPFILIWPILSFLFPVFSELNSKKDYNKINKLKELYNKYFITIISITSILFFLFSDIIAYILFGEKFLKSWEILKYSVLLIIFNFLYHFNANILTWIGKVKEKLKITSIIVVINIITNYIFIKQIWVYWAALATWLWWIIIWLLSEYYLWKKFRVKFNYFFFIKNIIISLILWFFIYKYVLIYFNELNRIKMFLYFILIAIFYYLIILMGNYKTIKYKNILKIMKNK